MNPAEDSGIYIHWPYCAPKCPYCDFNSHVARQIDDARWTQAYLSELDRVATETEGRRVATVFFGGGTPSLMPPRLVQDILDGVRRHWPVANDWEVTLEANPGSVEAGKFREFRGAGVNRVSLGVQALNDGDLKRLGRLHSAHDARAAFAIARDVFDRVSFDLIFGRQDQTVSDWTSELREALGLAVDHLSLYQLTIEPGTAFGDLSTRGKLRGLPDEDRSAEMFTLTQEICSAAGLLPYEVSNYARPGSESRHNLIYWHGGDYAGIGPGAHGRLRVQDGRVATETHRSPEGWLRAVETCGTGEIQRTILQDRDQAQEYILMGLRLSEGIDSRRCERLMGRPLETATLDELQQLGLIQFDEHRLRATSSGRLLLNAVIDKLARTI
jgi:oxygen-independent coproporphyrinogen-3 oxidase